MGITVRAHLLGTKLHRLDVVADGQFVGEYERSQEADITRKTKEVRCASELLLAVHYKYGEFKVRWNSARRAKVIYVNGVERVVIPEQCWEKPSWA
jgi:hypothetical protein